MTNEKRPTGEQQVMAHRLLIKRGPLVADTYCNRIGNAALNREIWDKIRKDRELCVRAQREFSLTLEEVTQPNEEKRREA